MRYETDIVAVDDTGLEAAVAICALRAGRAPPTYALGDEAGEFPGLRLVTGTHPQAFDRSSMVLSNSFAFGGHNVSFLFGQPT